MQAPVFQIFNRFGLLDNNSSCELHKFIDNWAIILAAEAFKGTKLNLYCFILRIYVIKYIELSCIF